MVRLRVRVRVWWGLTRVKDRVGGKAGLRSRCGLGFELVRVGGRSGRGLGL